MTHAFGSEFVPYVDLDIAASSRLFYTCVDQVVETAWGRKEEEEEEDEEEKRRKRIAVPDNLMTKNTGSYTWSSLNCVTVKGYARGRARGKRRAGKSERAQLPTGNGKQTKGGKRGKGRGARTSWKREREEGRGGGGERGGRQKGKKEMQRLPYNGAPRAHKLRHNVISSSLFNERWQHAGAHTFHP
ncbi:hypothetical protein ALC62_12931 [Cyphomyrmex costatus]|uniref:Uncharacterized protein n=1 Tax=Cyphomyrmex costatus TaxID=456900 RepID=A0A195C711_9HYME|nr:hypothetical protein ALC62_12931 [Cyphomyrmex costatus]